MAAHDPCATAPPAESQAAARVTAPVRLADLAPAPGGWPCWRGTTPRRAWKASCFRYGAHLAAISS
jgi:hypothetical protein